MVEIDFCIDEINRKRKSHNLVDEKCVICEFTIENI